MHQKFFDAIGGFRPEQDGGPKENSYRFPKDDFEWYKENGCEVVKICPGKGDLMLWDSRTVHWNCSPVGTQTRFATYVCYCPRSHMSEEMLQHKLENVFKVRKGTTHWPNMNIIPGDRTIGVPIPVRPDGTIDPADRKRPFVEPKETPEILKLVGVRV